VTQLISRVFENFPRKLMIGVIVVIFLMQVLMARHFEINWDEFLNLSMVYDHQRGTLKELLQTGFVHLFGWVTSISKNEVDEVIAARFFILGVSILTSISIFRIARQITDTDAALFAVIAFWAFTYNFRHAVSFRTDPLAACCMMQALWLALSGAESPRRTLTAGIFVGLAGVFTIKAIFLVPTICAVLIVRCVSHRGWKTSIWMLILLGASSLATFLGAIWLHSLTFTTYASPFAFLERTTQATLTRSDGSIFLEYFAWIAIQNLAVFVFLLFGLVVLLKDSVSRLRSNNHLYCLAMLMPIFIPLFYRDFYPYVYPFLFAPLPSVVAFGYHDISRRISVFVSVTLIGLVLASLIFSLFTAARQRNNNQYTVLEVIHDSFPADTVYIDARTMVSSFQKRGLFMSAWGMADYRRDGKPVMWKILETDSPRFVLANGPQLYLRRSTPAKSQAAPNGLLAEDFAILQENYLRLWGPIYVPGKRLSAGVHQIYIYVEGSYRLRGIKVAKIDGVEVRSGKPFFLSKGRHQVSFTEGGRLIMDIRKPKIEAPPSPLFNRF
jgi:hypothetical protein